ncbi:tetratricopeptide repeat protein [Streptomyces sp. NPDC048442]|uniref:tetratricopeptide repeat protein n=1 Tax=Streptomyces sp. NPDC048442 TaxID=3154823 RepID=UPI00343D1D6D
MPDQTWNSVGGQARVGTVVQAGHIGELNTHDEHHHHHHHGDPVVSPPAGIPYQIPPEPRHFEDRTAEQEAFRQLAADRPSAGLLVVNVFGTEGVGRTALAARLARSLRESCPDGVLHIDFDDHRTSGDGGVDRAAVLTELLHAFQVLPPWLGTTPEVLGKQYRTQTGRRRLVVVLDNVRTGTEITDCLPAGPGSVAVVVSQGLLHDFTDGPVLELPLGPLEGADSVRLLHHLADDPRLTAEPAAVLALARACGGLPAALHTAAQWLRKRRNSRIERLVAELKGKGLSMVENVWTAAYESLPEQTRRLYRALAVHPGPHLTAGAAAALLGTDQDDADAALDALENTGLLLRGAGGRLRLPDLLRDHAQHTADRDSVPGEAAAARGRLLHWHLRQAQRADETAAGLRMTFGPPVPVLPLPYAADVPFEDKAAALEWLRAERLVLSGCVRTGYAHGLDTETWALCEPLWTFHLDHPHPTETTEAFRTGVAAAHRAGDQRAVARMHCQLARLLWEQGEYGQASQELERAVEAAATTPERKLQASVAEFRGKLLAVQEQWAESVPYFEESRRIHHEIGNAYGAMLQTYLLGRSAQGMGDPGLAATLLGEAHTAARALGRERMTARTGFALGGVLHGLGRTDEARKLYEAALDSAQLRHSTFDEARVHEALAALATDTGDTERAAAHAGSAAAIRKAAGALEP